MTLAINGTTGITLAGQFDSASTFGFKNRIINGGMVIDQRNAGAVTTPTNGVYTLDRYFVYQSTAGKFSVQQTPSATETGYATRVAAGFTNYLAAVSLSAYTVLATDSYAIVQRIEAYNFSDMAWGTTNAKTITLSFLVYSSLTGTFGGALINSAGNRSYPFSYTVSSANTWTPISLTIAGDTSGTWLGATNGVGVEVRFGLGSGTNNLGTAGAWATGNYVQPTGTVSVVGTNSATFYITGVQLEKGSTATSFDFRPYTTELQLCQRYLPAWRASSTTDPVASGNQFSTTLPICMFVLPVETRAIPTGLIASNAAHFQFNGGNGSIAISSFTFSTASTKFAVTNSTTSAAGAIGYAGTLYIVNASGYIYFTGCEL
jgi:hypothetical protein